MDSAQLTDLLYTIRRDTADGELAYVKDVNEEDSQVQVVTKGQKDGEWWDAEDFTNVYNEHVIGVNEYWRLRRASGDRSVNPVFMGADVEITGLSLDKVEFEQAHVPLAADSDLLCQLLEAESNPLEEFLVMYDYVAKDDEDYDDQAKYEPTGEDIVKYEEIKTKMRETVKKHGAPAPKLAKIFIAMGLITAEELEGVPEAKLPGPLETIVAELEKIAEAMAAENGETGDKVTTERARGAGEHETHGKTAHERNEAMTTDNTQVKKLTANDFKDIKLENSGSQIILPVGMTKKVAIEWLVRLDKEDDRVVRLFHEIQAYPIEGAYALYRALKDKYGFTSLESTPGFFGDKPPFMVGLDISKDEHVQAPWGRIGIPGIAGFLETSANFKPDGSIRFVLSGEVKRRDEREANELIALVREYATSKSIYKGKAIRVKFPASQEEFDFTYLPEFIDTSKVREEDLVFPKEVDELVNVALFSPIEKTDLCRRLQIPLKRGILLEGPFGVGKTLSAYVTAKKCEQHGWTFMYLDKTADLKKAIMLARNYQPCVIFAEDIDRALAGEERDAKMDEILNTIDGIDGKSTEILVVLTTNNVEEINRAMLRPGRLDAVIPVRAPDAGAAIRLVRNYSCGLLKATDAEMVPVGEALSGLIPAVIREAVERAKLAAIVRLPEGTTELDLRPEDLLRANYTMKTQLELMQTRIEDKREPIEKAMATLADAVRTLGGDKLAAAAGKPNGAPSAGVPVTGVEA